MKEHDFFNLLSDKTSLALLKDGVWKYPEDFKVRYNSQVNVINQLALKVKEELSKMTEFEKEQFNYTAGG